MSRKEVNISDSVQLALAKLLGKLLLIDPTDVPANWNEIDHCPIAHFAKRGKCEESKAIEAVAQRLGISVLNINNNNIQRLILTLDDSRLSKIPIAKWREYRAIPVEHTGSRLLVALANPLDQDSRRALEFELGVTLEIAIAQESQILQVLNKQISSGESFQLENILGQTKAPDNSSPELHRTEDENQVFGEDLDSPPVIRLVNKILSNGVERGASDIHIEPEKDGLAVRVRIDGIMYPLFSVPNNVKNPVISRLKLLSSMDIAERRKPQDGRFRIKAADGIKDLRVSAVPTVHGEKIVIRILSADLKRLDLSSLGMQPEIERRFKRALQGSSRVILTTGPTGSGKTSTLYAGLLTLCDGTHNIVTIEDPIEYRIGGVNQIQVNPKIGLTFAEGLRSIVRQDPDVVMVGEIRDEDTASVAMQVAQTGHLVLSTLHTNSAASAVVRLLDMGLPAFVVASSLGAIMAQRLIRKLCPHCCGPVPEQAHAQYAELGLDPNLMRAPVGCVECANTGFSGRTGLYSLLEVDDEVREAIRTGKGERDLESLARKNGFQSIAEAARMAMESGLSSLEEVERVIGPVDRNILFPQTYSANSTTDTSPEEHGVGGPLKRKRVLLVEDDENTRSILSMLLQNEFFEVVEASNGFEGMEKVFELPPELVICDLMMPKMNGAELVKKLRADARTRDIPVLMLTAAGTEENEYQLLSQGADDFVNKGSETRVLLARVERLLNR